MHPWRWLTKGRSMRGGTVTGRDRSRLEAGLRQYYTSAFDEGWDPAAEGRIQARVSRAIAAQRVTLRAPGRMFRMKRVMGPHLAAIVCAGAAVLAFGGMIHAGRAGPQSQIPPTSSPVTGHSARLNVTAKLSLLPVQPPANLAIAI